MGAQDRGTGVLEPNVIAETCVESMQCPLTTALGACTVLELWLLAAMYRLKFYRRFHEFTFMDVYTEIQTQSEAADIVNTFGRVCAGHAWSNLFNMELLSDPDLNACRRRRGAASTAPRVCVYLYVAAVVLLRSCCGCSVLTLLLSTALARPQLAVFEPYYTLNVLVRLAYPIS